MVHKWYINVHKLPKSEYKRKLVEDCIIKVKFSYARNEGIWRRGGGGGEEELVDL
jgi:hypothetical protein